MGTRLTGSQLPRARHCAWAYREDVEYPQRPVGQAAEDGTEVHEMLECYLAGEPLPPGGPRAQLIFEQVRRHFAPGEAATPEPAFAINVETGEARLIGSRLRREYGELGPDEIALTADWVALRGDLVEIGDLKTGYAGHVSHPSENLQLHAACYAAAKVYGVKMAMARILIAREGESFVLDHTLDGGWMERVLIELREIRFRTQIPSPAVPGEHCQFCPALGACPQTGQLLQLGGRDEGIKWTTEHISVENDQKMVLALPMLKKAVEAVEDALKERGPIKLPGGKVWKETKRKMVTLDKTKAEELLGERYAACLVEKEVSGGWRQVRDKE